MKTLKRWYWGPVGLYAAFVLVVLCAVLMPFTPAGVVRHSSVYASSISNGGGGGGGAAGANVTTTFGATPAFICPSATQGTIVNFALSTQLTANITPTVSGCTNGSLLNFLFTQDGTGGRTVTMPGGFDQATVNPAAGVSTKCAYYLDATGLGHLTGGGCVSTAGFGFGLESAAPASAPPASQCFTWFDSTNNIYSNTCNNSATVSSTVVPATRPANQFLTSLSAAGVLGFNGIVAADVPASLTSTTSVNGTTIPAGGVTLTRTIASGTTAMPTAALGGNSCSAAATTSAASGIASTDAVAVTFASDPTGVTGYGGGTNGGITINAWPTSGQMNFKLCNQTAASITPGGISVNWRDTR